MKNERKYLYQAVPESEDKRRIENIFILRDTIVIDSLV